MPRLFRNNRLAAALALALAGTLAGAAVLAGAAGEQPQRSPTAAEPLAALGVMGTIPLYWGEAEALGEIIGGEVEPHWARARLEEHYRLHPLAALTENDLAPLGLLLLAQPRALSPAENVALDAWVRGGGRLLLFADPLLTGESRFAIGDRRRPQEVILLSPILRHWGLELEFVEDQRAGLNWREIAGQAVPVNLSGRFAPTMQTGCTLEAAGLLADCKIGQGRAVVLADATLLDLHHPAPEAASALDMLVKRALSPRDFSGMSPPEEESRGRDSHPPAPSARENTGAGFFQNLAAVGQNPP
jgi:hypothetical protein